MDEKILALFQLCDSNFPTGAFSHSYGLESYIQDNTVHNLETFSQWLQVYIHEQLIYSDGLAVLLTYEALEEENYDKVWKLDRLLTVQNLPRETREGGMRMGERMLELVQSLYETPVLSLYRERISKKQSFGHPAIVFTIAARYLGVSKTTTVLFYLYSVVSSIVQNAVRGIPLGQTAGQRVIRDVQPILVEAAQKIEQLDEEDFGIVSPGIELSQMRHERVNIRIFMS
ncbi:urease accessory protein UreF [Neobacillus mesonae]|uniref:Urease accessory protein UreF n=1 Tax=Neobacillus mesonae TaxID=1193713 RepID=A0A3Q9QW32_9BACI|nr:urease accessory protein UreF [Neobacillus mesonae]AZU62898.1 urease accessory protein UreF [Neobacillus mesonae]